MDGPESLLRLCGSAAVTELSDIAVFVEVVDRGSFTAAAERLNVSRPAVSKYVSRLEETVGARLLNRTTRRLSLTEAGQLFYERSRDALAEIDDARAEVARLQAEPRGTLRINVPMSFGILQVASLLPDFLKPFSSLRVDMHLDDRKLDVIEEGFDVSIRIGELNDSSLIARRLGPCRHVIVAAPAYLERRGAPRTPGDLADHAVLTYRYQTSALNWQFRDTEGGIQNVAVTGKVRMNNGLALRAALLGGAGVARMPTFVVGDDVRAGRLVSLLADYGAPEYSIFALYPERRQLSPKVRAFVDFMAERIGESPEWDRARRSAPRAVRHGATI